VRDSAALAEPVVKALQASHPRWLPGYQIKVLDGNHLSLTEHCLKELRSTWAAPLPGQALVVLDQQRMLITDVFLSVDGHTQQRNLIAQVLQHVACDLSLFQLGLRLLDYLLSEDYMISVAFYVAM
jgi:hypothetical protein